jgi:tetratricopeptide repeat protein
MRAFIVRPFGTKNEINFDQVEADLIDPALNRLHITGRTTMEIRRQGNIRVDMFQRLLTADIIIADISIQNANVYYELGVRHALRGKRTFLIRARGAGLKTDEVPFDLKTDRYLTYDGTNPKASIPDLVEGLRQTLNSEAQDSPVFQMLPDLAEQDRSRFLPIPRDFREEVERAKAAREFGDLELLAAEAHGFEWEIEGLRLIGRVQFNLKAFEGARVTWEAVRKLDAVDTEANTLLGTIYQRIGDLTGSTQALNRVLERKGLTPESRAEVHSLLARNAKTIWTNEWRSGSTTEQRQRQALMSPYLDEALKAYAGAFAEDLNHFYSGLNALAMLTTQIGLIELLPEVWADKFEEDDEAQRELASKKKQAEKLAATVELSLRAARERLRREQITDIWAEISDADLCLLTAKKPTRVASAYRNALAGATDFVHESVRRQLSLYNELGLFTENVSAALTTVAADGSADKSSSADPTPKRVVVFTGHMIDSNTRTAPRFPNKPDKIAAAKRAIAEAVANEQQTATGIAYGVAGGASGGDILFHQACEEMGIPTRILLALPPGQYRQTSVEHAGAEWVDSFHKLIESHPVRVLAESKELPAWLQEKPDYDIWQRNNLWTLHNALARAGGENVTVIALWNGEPGDGPGGTGDMVRKARERGAKTIILDTKKVFGD